MRVALSALVLLAFALTGEGISQAVGLLPGSLWGMLLLFLALRLGLPETSVAPEAEALLRWMPLLFVPVGVGVITWIDVLAARPIATGGALIGGTALTLVATGLILGGRR